MQVIEAARSRCNHVMVINDGATDATSDLLKSVENEVILIGYSPNRGKGYALKTAFREAKKRGFDYVITMDSDGQHSVDDLPVFLDSIQQHPDSLLIGSRGMNHPNMPQKNTFANKFSNFWFALQTAHRLPDTQSGYRLYPLRRMDGMHWLTSRYETELEILVRNPFDPRPHQCILPSCRKACFAFQTARRLLPHQRAECRSLPLGRPLWLSFHALAQNLQISSLNAQVFRRNLHFF